MGPADDLGQPEDQAAAGGPRGAAGAPSELGDALRTAVERTLAATADSATETRQRAQGLLDEVVRRGQVAREGVARRGEEATNRVADAINDLRAADGDELRDLGQRIDGVERRLAALEARPGSRSNPQGEPQWGRVEPLERGDS